MPIESLSVSKGPKTIPLTASKLDGFVASVGGWITVLTWMEKLPSSIKLRPLNNFADYSLVFWESEEDGEAWEDWDEDEAEVPAITLLSSNFGVCICCFVETVL